MIILHRYLRHRKRLADNNIDRRFSSILISMVQLSELPSELQSEIVNCLTFPDNVNLKRTCRHFYGLVHLDQAAQMEAENSLYAAEKRLFVCSDCHRILPSQRFADKMIRRSRRRGGSEAWTRFCIDCGVTPRGQNSSRRYTPGAHISIQGMHYVICQACRTFGKGAQDRDHANLPYCVGCMRTQRATDQRLQQREAERRSREARRQRRMERYAFWGSDHDEDTDDPDSDDRVPSLTSDEIFMDMVQAEADGYMNSPKAGSE